MIFTSNPRASYLAQKEEINEAIYEVLNSERYILGQSVDKFEREFASFCQVNYGIGVANGTDAIEIAIRALGIGSGDEVITVSHTAVATACGIERSGARPVFVDIDPTTFTINTSLIEERITPKTKAIVPVHIYGHPADMRAIMELASKYDIKVIEDCAQAHGASISGKKVGSFGHAAAFSFYPTKNLGAIGDAGMVLTSDVTVAERARSLRQYGWDAQQVSQFSGINSRLDELQAAILLVKLQKLDFNTAKRIQYAETYCEHLKNTPVVLPHRQKDAIHVYHQFVIEVDNRDSMIQELKKRDIFAGIHYAVPAHKHPAYINLDTENYLPVTEKKVDRIISLPIFPELEEKDVMKVIDAIKQILS